MALPSDSNAASKKRVKKARRRMKKGKRVVGSPTEDFFNRRMTDRLVNKGYD